MGFQDKLGSVFVEVRAKLDKYKRDMRQAVSTTRSSASKMQASMSKFASANKAALLGVGAAMALATRNVVQFADQIDKMSVKTGLSIETLQGLEFASTQLGFSFQTIETLGFRVTRRMGEAAEGSERVAEAFKQAGVELKDSSGKFRDVNDVFPELLDNLSKMENAAERNALGVKIFDTEFRTLLPLLEAGAGSIKGMTDKAKDLGIILDTETIKGMVEFGDTTDILSRRLRTLFITIAGPILKGFSSMINLLNVMPGALNAVAVAAASLAVAFVALGGPVTILLGLLTALGVVVGTVYDDLSKAKTLNQATNDIKKYTKAVEEAEKALKDAKMFGKFQGGGEGAAVKGAQRRLDAAKAELKAAQEQKKLLQDIEDKTNKDGNTATSTIPFKIDAEKIKKEYDELVKSLVEESRNSDIEITVNTSEKDKLKQAKKDAQEIITAQDTMRENIKGTFRRLGSFLLEGDFKGALASLAETFATNLQNKLMDSLSGSVADMLLNSGGSGGGSGVGGGIMSAASSFFGGFFADGGQPPVGKMSMVGERGPEMFVPKSAGTIIPNHALGGSGGTVVQNNTFNGDAVSRQELAAWSTQLKHQIIQETGRKASGGGAFGKQFGR